MVSFNLAANNNSINAITHDIAVERRFGLGGTSVIYFLLHLSGFAALVWLAATGGIPAWVLIVPALLLALAWQAARAIRVGVADRPAMTRAIEMTLAIHTIGSIWLAGCALFVAFFSA